MNIAQLSIKRPIFICSIVLLMLLTGWVALGRMGVDLFPDVNIPIVSVTTIYPGAGPEEIEELVSKPLEEELSSIAGLKKFPPEIRKVSPSYSASLRLQPTSNMRNNNSEIKSDSSNPNFPPESKNLKWFVSIRRTNRSFDWRCSRN